MENNWQPKLDEWYHHFRVESIDGDTVEVLDDSEGETLTMTVSEFEAIVGPGDYMLRYTDEEGDAGLYGDPADEACHEQTLIGARSWAEERAWKSGIPIEIINWETKEVVELVGEKYKGKGILQHDMEAMAKQFTQPKQARYIVKNHLTMREFVQPWRDAEQIRELLISYVNIFKHIYMFDIGEPAGDNTLRILADGKLILSFEIELEG